MFAIPIVCKSCGADGAVTALQRCSACCEVFYCDRRCQVSHRRLHRAICNAASAVPQCVFVEVAAGEGNGLSNRMVNYVFPTKADGVSFVSKRLAGIAGPLRSFFAESVGWDVEFYCRAAENVLQRESGRVRLRGKGTRGINGAGVFLGAGMDAGLSEYANLDGEIFVTGRRVSDGMPMNSDNVWGVLNYIWDAMDLFEDEMGAKVVLTERAEKYARGAWEPDGGAGKVDVYNTDYMNTSDKVEVHSSHAP